MTKHAVKRFEDIIKPRPKGWVFVQHRLDDSHETWDTKPRQLYRCEKRREEKRLCLLDTLGLLTLREPKHRF